MQPLIDANTKILGLIADPIVQARTPGMANALLYQHELFGAFALIPMQVSAEGLSAFVAALKHLRNFNGAVVSMPHKVAMAGLVDELTPEARLVGAVNVIRRHSDGRLEGTVLDGEGFAAGLASAGHRIAGTNCLLVGAGGAASAIAFALAKYGCASVCLLNRTQSKAEALAARVRRAFPHITVTTMAPPAAHFDIAINGTALGMNMADALPVTASYIERSALVAECVIAPEMTRLLELAVSKRRAIHTGVPMLTAQIDMMLAFMGATSLNHHGFCGDSNY
jgi:shikimate dehydrogenase